MAIPMTEQTIAAFEREENRQSLPRDMIAKKIPIPPKIKGRNMVMDRMMDKIPQVKAAEAKEGLASAVRLAG